MDAPLVDLYEPTAGGWRLRLSRDPGRPRPTPGTCLGAVGGRRESSGHEQNPDMEQRPDADDARQHRRPLFPPADRHLLFGPQELPALGRMSFRPLVLAYNAPRFLLDLHLAGGLMGHLRLGLVPARGPGRWLEDWAEIEVEYTDGSLVYRLTDPDWAGVTVVLEVAALATAVGLVARFTVTGAPPGTGLLWVYGGASAFYTGYNFGTPHFRLGPGQADRDQVGWVGAAGWLRRAFAAGDAVLEQAAAAPVLLPGWTAVLAVGSDGQGQRGRVSAAVAAGSEPAAVWAATIPADGATRTGDVLVERLTLADGGERGHLVVAAGQAGEAARAAAGPAWVAAQARGRELAGRVTTRTPDAHLDAACRMIGLATEGTWGDLAFLHGGWSWRSAYLGWRTWYGPTCYGWTDRVRRAIEQHLALNQVQQGIARGAMGAVLESPPGVGYNMGEVFIDHLRHYLDYTGDLELARRALPHLEQLVAWENRRLQPEDAGLYENSLNTWISDSHWATGAQCTQASAYMLRAHELLAELCRHLGLPRATAYRAQAERIHAALQQQLWQPAVGVFAECRDTRGHRLLHPEPELPTIYHAAEFGAATPLQVYQMLHWADTHLRQVEIPGGGRFFWSSNWHPNNGRSYTHSTYELAYAEELNFALTQWQAGRAEMGYALLRGTLAGLFNGPTPGGLACHTYADGRQRGNDEFADASSMWARAVVEGLFGIQPQRLAGHLRLGPQFPAPWSEAAIRAPHFAYTWQQPSPGRQRLLWQAPTATPLACHWAVRAATAPRVAVDGQAVTATVTAGVNLTWVDWVVPAATHGEITLDYEPLPPAVPLTADLEPGQALERDLGDPPASALFNPQAVLRQCQLEDGVLRGVARREPGPGLLFVLRGPADCPHWQPLAVTVAATPARAWTPPPATRPGLGPWTLVDLGPVYNAPLVDVPARVLAAATPPAAPALPVNWAYRNEHLVARQQPLCDAAWRGRIGADGVGWTADGIPFRSPREGDNIAIVTRAGGFPSTLRFAVGAAGSRLYLMLSGMTFPAQSHVPNLALTLLYADGERQRRELRQPQEIGDCWGTWLGRFHDTPANGFENLGGRHGPAGSVAVRPWVTPVAVDTEAHLVALDLRPAVKLQAVELEAVAEDVIFGAMGATLAR